MISRKVIDFWVGVFVILGLLAILFLSLNSANLLSGSANTYRVEADFDNVGGLKVRAPVKSAGVTVGRVVSIDLNPDTHKARVIIEIDDKYDFSSDVSANILTSGLLGEQYLGLNEGFMPDKIRETGVINITSSAVVLEDLVNKLLLSFIDKPSR